MLMEKRYWLYILKLEQGKYYVGVTSRSVSKRVSEHQYGFMGAKWTRRYKPIQIIDKRDLGVTTYDRAEQYETRVTTRYMKKYGINNVRGGLLTDEGNYVQRFSYLFKTEVYQNIVGVIVMMLVILALGILYFLK
jgi:predicted GIY-YIG superfamily endonuclease